MEATTQPQLIVQETPQQLLDLRDAYGAWLPMERKLRVRARLAGAFSTPRTNLNKVFPQFARWMIADEIYGVQQFLPESKQLSEIVHEVLRLLDIQAVDDTVPDVRVLELQEALLTWGARLTTADHVAAGAAWQVVYNSLIGSAPEAIRYYLFANKLGQPGEGNTAMLAALESSLRKLFDLLKI